jgi:sorting nexin-29
LFIDYKAAYDSIRRDKLFSAMEEFEILNKLINLTRVTLKRVRCRVKIQKDLSDLFITERGLRQGDILACLLFNIALDKVIRNSGKEMRGTTYHKPVQVLAYSDDLDIIGRSERAVREAFTKLDKEAQLMGLKTNENKTKYMEITTNPTRTEFSAVGKYKFEKVTEFKYLGTLITSNNNIEFRNPPQT